MSHVPLYFLIYYHDFLIPRNHKDEKQSFRHVPQTPTFSKQKLPNTLRKWKYAVAEHDLRVANVESVVHVQDVRVGHECANSQQIAVTTSAF